MRTSWIVIATAVLGSVIGLGLTYFETVSVGDRFDNSYVDPNQLDPDKRHAQITVIGKLNFDFGNLEKNRSGSCTLKLENSSEEPLTVDFDGVSCGLCVETEFKNATVQPGKNLTIKINYTTHKDGPEFAEYLEIRTNDPNYTVIRFDITGYVTQAIRFSRSDIRLGHIAVDEDASATFRIFGYEDEPIEVISQEFTTQRSADYFSLELTPLELKDFKKDEPRAKSAVLVRLTMADGKKLGPVKQILRITAKLGETSTTAEIIIRATIVSDISLIGGRDFNSEHSLIRLGSILGTIDHSTILRIRIRGPHRDKVKLSIASIDPENVLKATIGEPIVVGKGYLYPVTISIPRGAPSINRLGSVQGKWGVINIETTHPTAKEMPIYVSFAIE
jgi:hypothetical protein